MPLDGDGDAGREEECTHGVEGLSDRPSGVDQHCGAAGLGKGERC